MSTNVEYNKLDLAKFVTGYLAMIKTYMPEGFKFILTHPELFMLKGISYTWSNVRSFHVHISCIAWNGPMWLKFTFFKHSDLRPSPTSLATSSSAPPSRTKPDTNQENRGCLQWTDSCNCDKEKDTYSTRHKCCVYT